MLRLLKMIEMFIMTFDKWLFFIGILFLFIYFLIRKNEKKINKILLIIAVFFLFAPLLLPRQIFGKWDSIKILKNKRVSKIILQPSQPEWEVNLTDSIFIISNNSEINFLIDLLKKTDAYIPSHPTRIWETKMTLVTKDNDSLFLQIEKTENNGTVIYEPTNRFRNDDLAEYLEKITNFTTPHFSVEFKKK